MRNIITRYLRERAGGLKEFKHQMKADGNSQIHLLNWWNENDSHREWLRKFIISQGILNGTEKTVSICSLFGPRAVLGWSDDDIRIFFSGENLHLPRWSHYADYMLSGPNPFDLGLGFDYFEDDRYLRFPLWIMYLFPPNATEQDIARICNNLRYPQINTGKKFCSLISRWDPSGVRRSIHEALSPLGHIDCPSAFLHNDDSLIAQFQDNKSEYLKQYKFNICPENSNAIGYTTEKIFESISSGCIPIYSGSMGHPEPEIINRDAVLIWKDGGDNSELISTVEHLNSDEKAYQEFTSQPRLVVGAEEWVMLTFKKLVSALSRA